MILSNKEVIVLWGKGDRGKTTTLKLLIEELINLGAKKIDGGDSNLTNDIWAILEYKNKKIGIVTVGDDQQSLKKYFDKLNNECDIYICASRTKGISCDYIKTHFTDSVIIWQEKLSITVENKSVDLTRLQDLANKAQVSVLIETIERYV